MNKFLVAAVLILASINSSDVDVNARGGRHSGVRHHVKSHDRTIRTKDGSSYSTKTVHVKSHKSK